MQPDQGIQYVPVPAREDVKRDVVGEDGLLYNFRPGLPEISN